jgi:hypothetical protein
MRAGYADCFSSPDYKKKVQNKKKKKDRVQYQFMGDSAVLCQWDHQNFSVYDFIEQFFPLILFT